MSGIRPVPVIDLFAGPGGLGEGFAAIGRRELAPVFEIRLSIEKDPLAHQTLELRSFVRQFPIGRAPEAYYDFLRKSDRPLMQRRRELFNKYPEHAARAAAEAWLIELGKEDRAKVRERIERALGSASEWVLLGGPPCQAYSVAGRSRNKRNPKYQPEADERQTLYVEYLQIIADHQPTVFVMENVKGLLSATHRNQRMFERIIEDLQTPSIALAREERAIRPPQRYLPRSTLPDSLSGLRQ